MTCYLHMSWSPHALSSKPGDKTTIQQSKFIQHS